MALRISRLSRFIPALFLSVACTSPSASAVQPEERLLPASDDAIGSPDPSPKSSSHTIGTSSNIVSPQNTPLMPDADAAPDVTTAPLPTADDLQLRPQTPTAEQQPDEMSPPPESGLAIVASSPTFDENTDSDAPEDLPQFVAISDDLSPLPEDIRTKLHTIPWDVEPEVLHAVEKENEGGHFPWSDEKRPDKFYESIRGLGGTYIGVGTDQAYVYMGWQRPTLAFAIDYDPWIICIHYGYLALFDTCEDIDCFKKMLEDKKNTYQFLLQTYYASHPNRKQIAKIFRDNAHGILRRINRIENLEIPTFVTDKEMYQYIRTLVKTGRIITMQANLLGNTAFKAIAQTLRDYGRTVTTLYTSNAEQYWGYNRAFKENMRVLPWSDNGMIMRTIATKRANGDYTYRIMPYRVFLAWLADSRGTNVYKISRSYVIQTREENDKLPPDIPFILDDRMPPDIVQK